MGLPHFVVKASFSEFQAKFLRVVLSLALSEGLPAVVAAC